MEFDPHVVSQLIWLPVSTPSCGFGPYFGNSLHASLHNPLTPGSPSDLYHCSPIQAFAGLCDVLALDYRHLIGADLKSFVGDDQPPTNS